MLAKCFGEFMGTLVLILLGDGVVANVLLKRSKAEGAGWMVITSGWAFAVMAGVFTAVACGSSDAHINPAVTFGFAVETGQFAKFAPYVIAQMAGAFVGAILVWLHFLPHWKETESKDFKLLCFCTVPAIRNFVANLISEIIGTFLLVFVVGAIFSKAVAGSGLVSGLGAYLVAALVGASDCRLVELLVTRSIPLETWGRGLHTRYCQSRTRGRQIGAMPSYQFSGLL